MDANKNLVFKRPFCTKSLKSASTSFLAGVSNLMFCSKFIIFNFYFTPKTYSLFIRVPFFLSPFFFARKIFSFKKIFFHELSNILIIKYIKIFLRIFSNIIVKYTLFYHFYRTLFWQYNDITLYILIIYNIFTSLKLYKKGIITTSIDNG